MELESYFKKYFIYVFLLFLSGCAVKYHAAEDGPSGYRDAQVSSDVFYVEYTIHGFALKRCAEIAKKKGYAFFDVLSKDEKTVYLESAVDQIVVANMGNLASDPPTATVYSTAGKRVEGRRVTYQIKLLNE